MISKPNRYNKPGTWFIGIVTTITMLFPDQSIQIDLQNIVKNFSCVTFNFDEYVKCTWSLDADKTTLDYIHLNVTWSIDMYRHYSDLFICPKQTKTSCILEKKTTNLDMDRKIVIYLETMNKDDKKASFHVDTPRIVKPDLVSYLKSETLNSTCVKLVMGHTHHIWELTYRIRATDSWGYDSREEMVDGSDDFEIETTNHVICGLNPYTLYSFNVSCKPAYDGFWSDDKVTEAMTLKNVPFIAPKMAPGGFKLTISHHKGYRNVEVFWQHLEERYNNGENVSYLVSVDPVLHSRNSRNKTTNLFSAKLNNLLKNSTYNIVIKPFNEVGFSENFSTIVIPSENDLPDIPTDVIAKGYENSTVIVKWYLPNATDITNVTFYWCKKSIATTCLDDLKWQSSVSSVNSTTLQIADHASTSYLFGISAESIAGLSSGFQWTQCVIMDNENHHDLEIMIKPMATENTMSVNWQFSSCDGDIFRGQINQFILRYCSNTFCKVAEFIYIDGTANSATISDVNPDETICIDVSAELEDGRKIQSDQVCEIMYDANMANVLPLPAIIAFGVVIFMLCCLGAWFVSRKSVKQVGKCCTPFAIDIPEMLQKDENRCSVVTVETPCLDQSNSIEPSETSSPTSDTSLLPRFNISDDYVKRDSGT